MPPKRKASTNPPNTSEPTATDPPKAKRTRSSKAAQPTADASTDSAKPRRKRNPTTSLKSPLECDQVRREAGVDKGSEAKTQVEAPAAKKPQNRNRKAAAPPKDEAVIYQTMAEDEDEELSEDSEVENAPSVPTTSLPITLRLRVPSPKRSYFTHPSANSMHDLIEKCVSVSDSDFEIGQSIVQLVKSDTYWHSKPLPPKVKLPKDLRALGTTSRIVQVVESDEDEDSGDDVS
ncbi:hypothetical protein RhiJN_11816 [Ceratobasidium sp. AG-Ba]|nr:hypothetical protein RhiJN_11816 [Ceratobasidium sp. AG-Ba]